MALVLEQLALKGHETQVIIPEKYRHNAEAGKFNGVKVDITSQNEFGPYYSWADIVLTQLAITPEAVECAKRHQKPLACYIHSHYHVKAFGLTPKNTTLIIFNSKWMQKYCRWSGDSIVIPPPIIPENYKTIKGKAITLINLLPNKGSHLFYKLAGHMPERKFLGVKGTRGKQHIPAKIPANVEIMEPTTDMKSVYEKTGILLMPSRFRGLEYPEWTESWGRCAIEAAWSGIPTIAHPCPGLLESLNSAGIFCDRDKPEDWINAVRRLDDPHYYEMKSKQAKIRAENYDYKVYVNLLEEKLLSIACE